MGVTSRELESTDVIRALIRISEVLTSNTPIADRMESLCRETATILDCDRSSIMVWDGEYFRGTYNFGNPDDLAKTFPNYRARMDAPLVQEGFTTGTCVVVNSARSHEATRAVARMARIESIVLSPMTGPDQEPLGFMTAEFNERLGTFDSTKSELALGAARLAQVAITADRARKDRRKSAVQRRQLLGELVRAEDSERRRISREIHDDSLQQILALRLKLDGLALHVQDPAVKSALSGLIEDTYQAGQTLRRLLSDVHPLSLDIGDLADAIHETLSRSAERAGWELKCENEIEVEPGPEMATVLFRIATQTIQNVEAHANAKTVSARIWTHRDGTCMTITDDGAGFDPTLVESGRFGLVSMRERAEHAGGTCQITTNVGEGTTVSVWIPHSI